MSTIDDFIEAEKAKMTWWDKIFRNYPDVRTTRFHSVSVSKSKFDIEQVISPSGGLKLQALIILFFSGLAWVAIFSSLHKGRYPLAVSLLALLVVTVLIILFFYRYFIDKRLNYTIAIDHAGINIGGSRFLWEELAETCILTRQAGKTTNNYLILFNKVGSVYKFDLWMLRVSSARLATVIEYYKNNPR